MLARSVDSRVAVYINFLRPIEDFRQLYDLQDSREHTNSVEPFLSNQKANVRVLAGSSPGAVNDDETASPRRLCSITKSRRQARKLQRRIERALAAGKAGDARNYQAMFLKSFSARHVATHDANRRMKKRRRERAEQLPEIAAQLNAWEGTPEPAHVFGKPKSGGEYRPIHSFGLQGRALQRLVHGALEPFAQLHPAQTMLAGGGRRAMSAIKSAIESGCNWAANLDVVDCYSSYDARGVVDCLPVPRRVTANVVVAQGYNTTVSRLLGSTDPTTDLDGRRRMSRKSRSGLPQGAASSALVNEMLIAAGLPPLPANVVPVIYADNILVLAPTLGQVRAATTTLRAAFQQHPAGFLTLHELPPRKVSDGFGFLGYKIAKKHGHVEVRPSDWNLYKEAMLFKIYLHLARSERDFVQLRADVKSWCSNFDGWEDAPLHRWVRLRQIEKRYDEVFGVRHPSVGLTEWLDQRTGRLPAA